MRLLLCCLLLFPFFAFGQNGYDCFNQSKTPSNWTFLGPTNAPNKTADQHFGHINCISVNPTNDQEIFVASPTGGLYKTTSRGKNWSCLTDKNDLPIIGPSTFLVDYTKQPYHIVIGTGTGDNRFEVPNFGIFKSIDGGKTWLQKKINTNVIFEEPIFELMRNGNKMIALGKTAIFISYDQGDNWKTLIHRDKKLHTGSLKERDLRFCFWDKKNDNIYFSTTLKYISSGLESSQLFRFKLNTNTLENLTPSLDKFYGAPKNEQTKIATQIFQGHGNEIHFAANLQGSNKMIIYTFDTEQDKLTDFNIPATNLGGEDLTWFCGFRTNKKNKSVLYLCGRMFFKSTDGGDTFKRMYNYSFGDNNIPHADARSIQIMKYSDDGEKDHIYIGTDGGLSFSDNGGKSFTNLNGTKLPITQFHGVGASPFTGVISAGAQDNSIFTYLPKTKEWIFSVRGDGYDVVYDKNKTGLFYGQYNTRSLLKSKNDKVPLNYSTGYGKSENSSIKRTLIAHTNGDLFFADTKLNYLEKGKNIWQKKSTPLKHKAIAFAVAETNPNIIYMSGEWGDLIKSSDKGETWTKLNENLIVDGRGYKNMKISSICISPYDAKRVWLGFGLVGSYNNLCASTNRIITTNDGGKTWSDASQGLPIFAVEDIAFYRGSYDALFMACAQGVYYKKASGYKWERFSENLPQTIISEIEINYCRGKIIASTFGRGLWEADLPPIAFKNPYIIRKKERFSAQEGEAKFMDRDIIIKKRGSLVIDCPLHMPKGSKIQVKNKKQLIVTENGKLLNDCGEKWQGITTK